MDCTDCKLFKWHWSYYGRDPYCQKNGFGWMDDISQCKDFEQKPKSLIEQLTMDDVSQCKDFEPQSNAS